MENIKNYSNSSDYWDPITESPLDRTYDLWAAQERADQKKLIEAIKNHDMETLSDLFPLENLTTFKLNINELMPIEFLNGWLAPIHLACVDAYTYKGRNKWDVVLHLLATKKVDLNLKMDYELDDLMGEKLSVKDMLQINTEWMIYISEFCLKLDKSYDEQREIMRYLFSIVEKLFPDEWKNLRR